MAAYTVRHEGQDHGPYTLEALKTYIAAGSIRPTDLWRCAPDEPWQPISALHLAPTPTTPAQPARPAPTKQTGNPLLALGTILVIALVIIGACTSKSTPTPAPQPPATQNKNDKYEAEQIAKFGLRPTPDQATRIIYLYLDPKEEHFRDYDITWVGAAGRTNGGWCHTVRWSKRNEFGDMVPQKSLFFIDHGKVIETAQFPDVTH